MNALSPLQRLRQQLKQQQHRTLVILSGSCIWQAAQLQALWSSEESILWLGSSEMEAKDHTNQASLQDTIQANIQTIEPSQLSHLLGQETDSVIIDVQTGLNANALGISAGMIRSGGLLVLLTPDLESWRTLANPDNQRFLNSPYQIEQAHPYFTEHLIRQWQSDSITPATWLHEHPPSNTVSAEINLQIPLKENTLPKTSHNLPTAEQIKAIETINSVAFGHRKRPLVITADRGRGKSSLLGLAAIQCLIQGKAHIVLTASRLDQVKTAFIQALGALEQASKTTQITFKIQQPSRLCFEFESQLKTFEFIAPDQLIITPTKADVLMVDEAAHLPSPLLTDLLNRHHRMVFATTLHGYEGSGRGFELRFKKTLNQLTPNWKNQHLKKPIRWAENDPLEAAINHALFLNSTEDEQIQPVVSKEAEDIQQTLQLQEISLESLLADPIQFHRVFTLLVQAHYQTSPNDLQQLLSAPNLKIITAKQQGQLLGVILCVEEGKIMPKTKRAHGHLVPQLLVKHYALSDFLMLSSWRVMRIAVHPNAQRKGVGKRLLNHLTETANQQRIDYLSSSFGASEELLPFWFQQGYQPIHVGVKRDKSSGSHNIVVARTLSSMARQAIACIQRAFQAQFPHTLMESLPYLPTTIVLTILQSFRFRTQIPQLEEAIQVYRLEERAYESVSGQLWEWTVRNPHKIALSPTHLQSVWCDKILKKQSWADVAHQHHLAGRKGVEKAMIELLANILPQ